MATVPIDLRRYRNRAIWSIRSVARKRSARSHSYRWLLNVDRQSHISIDPPSILQINLSAPKNYEKKKTGFVRLKSRCSFTIWSLSWFVFLQKSYLKKCFITKYAILDEPWVVTMFICWYFEYVLRLRYLILQTPYRTNNFVNQNLRFYISIFLNLMLLFRRRFISTFQPFFYKCNTLN